MAIPYLDLERRTRRHGPAVEEAVRRSRPLARGVNVMRGHITSRPVAESHALPHVPLAQLVEAVDPAL